MTWRDGAAKSTGGEAASGRGNGGDDANWVDMNFTGSKNEENPCNPFSCYKWIVKTQSNDELSYFF
jgi:hypothetical protein